MTTNHRNPLTGTTRQRRYIVRVPNAATSWHRSENWYTTDSLATAKQVAKNYASHPVSNRYAIVQEVATGRVIHTERRPKPSANPLSRRAYT